MTIPLHLVSISPTAVNKPRLLLPKKKNLRKIIPTRFGLVPVRSPLLRESLLFYIPLGTEMFHFPRSSSTTLCIQVEIAEVCSAGFPHSETSGSKVAYHLPEDYRRLLRPSSSIDV